ncbi:MAG TPA: nitrate- and nitrite sensing domain-containing protein, partial [Acidimicrobiales bacterium]
MRRVPISIKLWVALAAPLLGLLTITVIEIAKASREVNSIHDQAELATASIGPTGVTDGLQDERNYAVAKLVGFEDAIPLDVSSTDESRQQTDAAIDEFRTQILQRGGRVAEAYRPALEALNQLGSIRDEIDANQTEPTLENNSVFGNTVFDRYAELITPFLDANTRVVGAINDPALSQGARLVDTTS